MSYRIFLPATLAIISLSFFGWCQASRAQDAGGAGAVAPAAAPATAPAATASPYQNISIYRNGVDHTGNYDTDLSPKLAVAWQTTNEGSTNNISSPVIHDGILYFGAGKHVWAVSADDGHVIWSYPLATSDTDADAPTVGAFDSPPTYDAGKIYIGNDDNKLYVLDAKTGDNLWQFATKGGIRSAPIVNDGVVYFGSYDNTLYALNIDTQRPVWGGNFKTAGGVIGSVALSGRMIYFSDSSQTVYGVNLSNGQILWSQILDSPITGGTPVFDRNLLYFSCGTSIIPLNYRVGTGQNPITFPDDVTSPVAIGGPSDLLFAATLEPKLYAVDRRGNVRWTFQLDDIVRAAPIVTNTMVIACTESGTVYGLDVNNGKLVWSYTVLAQGRTLKDDRTQINASPVASGGHLFVLSDDGTITAFSPDAPNDVAPTLTPKMPTTTDDSIGAPIQYSIEATDIGSGINPTTVSLTVDGKDVPVEFDPRSATIRVKRALPDPNAVKPVPVTLPTLTSGSHTAVVSAADWHGNKATKTWIFTVDNKLNDPGTPPPP